VRVRLEQRLDTPRWLTVAVPVGSVLAALVVGAVFLVATGHDPIETYRKLAEAAYTTFYGITDTIGYATPLMFTALAAAVAFRMNLFNIGGEGQLYLGMITGAWAGFAIAPSLPGPLANAVVLVFGALGGAMWVLVPALARARLGSSEIVTTLLLNYVALNLVNYLIYGTESYWRDPTTPFPQGKALDPGVRMQTIGSTTVYPLVFVGIALAVALWFVNRRTNFGYQVSVVADSPPAARYAGISTTTMTVSVLLLSGALAGTAGAVEVLGPAGKLDPGVTGLGLGYAGIVVAALAHYNPIAIVPVAVLFGGLRTGGEALQASSDPVPIAIAVVLQGAILLFALGGEMFRKYRIRVDRRPAPTVVAPPAPPPSPATVVEATS
jgi:simple sugar transport system permease protein